MNTKTYKVIGNRTSADVVANNDEVIETGYSLEAAKIAAIQVQKTGKFIAAWVEEEAPASSRRPVIIRSVEQDHRGNRYKVTRCDGWMI